MFQADELLLALRHASVRFVVIGGVAVGVHGYVRATKDLDIVPDPEQLAQGANFRLETRLGPLDIMQWVAGIEEDPAYPALARQAITVPFRGEQLLVCGLNHLRAMKLAAGREEDLRDLHELGP